MNIANRQSHNNLQTFDRLYSVNGYCILLLCRRGFNQIKDILKYSCQAIPTQQ